MKSSYKRLLPGSTKHATRDSNIDSINGSHIPPATCSVNLIACDPCRRKKAKCDGQRPVCDRCSRGGSYCKYDADVGESRSAAMKKKYRALNKDFHRLTREVHQLRRFYGYIRAAPQEEAYSIFLQIRASGGSSPIDVLDSLNRQERKPSLTSNDDSNCNSIEVASPRPIEIHAAPWTTVAGNEVVAELITQYFTYDYLYVFPPINRSVFFREMASPNIMAATSCSPVLVNAICAQQCLLSPRDFLEDVPRLEMAERFLDEANRLLPHALGNFSLATCQAACLIFAAASAKDQLNDDDS
ncbi:hypothetical protein E4U21_001716 [Claviceps maximensis]|nr:hypothetical protein E4U21_001716 [Claviceps maximensis]